MAIAQSNIGVEWLDGNASRAYPFVDDATLLDSTGSQRLPSSLIVDLSMSVPAASDLDPAAFHLFTLVVGGTTISMSFSGPSGIFGTLTFTIADHTRNKTYLLQGNNNYPGGVARVTIGDLTSTLSMAGSWVFTSTTARIVPTCIRPDTRHVTSIRVGPSAADSLTLDGDVQLLAGTNTQFRAVSPGNPSLGVYIDAISGQNLSEDCTCGNVRDLGDPIRTINGIGPDGAGNFQINSLSGCLVIAGGQNSIQFTEDCADPCCTSSEIETLVAGLETLKFDQRSLVSSVNDLLRGLSQISSMRATLRNIINSFSAS